MTGEPTSSGILGFAIWKFGTLKLLGVGAALIGALIMAIFRPPLTRKEMMYQAAVAIGASLLFGSNACRYLDSIWSWINLTTDSTEDVMQFVAMVHGLIGASAWGVFGGIAVLRDKFGSDPIQTAKDIKDIYD